MPVLIGPAIGAGLGISAAAGTVVGGLVFTVGATLLTFLLAPKPESQSGNIPFKQSIPPRGFGYGRVRVTGAVMCLEAHKGQLLKVHALLSHRCHAFVTYYLHDDPGSLGGSGFFQGGPGRRYGKSKDRVRIESRLGVVPETAYSAIVARTSLWTNNHRGDGICSMSFVASDSSETAQPKDYPFGPPIPSAVVDAALVYDPRDGDQDPDDDSTWAWSDNPVLCILHYLCFSEFGYRRDYATAILPYVETWKAQADHCDEPVDLAAGGTEKRYRFGLHFTTEHAPRAVLGQMLAACDGWIVDRGDGGVDIRVGVFEEPEIVLTDDDIVGFDLPYGIADEEVVNRLDLSFTDPGNHYAEVDLPPWENEADQASRGVIREHRFELRGVQSPTQARRLGKREYTRLQEPLRGTIDIRLDKIDAVYARWIRVQSATIPQLADKVIENRAGHLSLLAGSLRIAFIGSGEHIDDWSTDDEDNLPGTPGGDVVEEPTLENLNWQVIHDTGSNTLAEQGTTSASLTVSFDPPENGDSYSYRVTWCWDGAFGQRFCAFQDFAPPHPHNPFSMQTVLHSMPVRSTDQLTVSVAVIGSTGAISDGSDEEVLDTSITVEPLQATAADELRATTSSSLRAI